MTPVEIRQPSLFDDAPQVDEYTLAIARGGRSHFRDQLRRYGAQFGYLVPYWAGMIRHFERMAAFGYEAAMAVPMPEHPDGPSPWVCARQVAVGISVAQGGVA